jgi:hypothetical protein
LIAAGIGVTESNFTALWNIGKHILNMSKDASAARV